MNSRTPSLGYMSETSGLLDMVARGCIRLQRIGGGVMAREYHAVSAAKVTANEHQLMNKYICEGKSILQIAAILKRSKAIVGIHTRETRRIAIVEVSK